jgi:hypothetical protein
MERKRTAHIRNGRRSVRRAPRSSTRVVGFGGKLGLGPNIATHILDISETGARLRVREQCARGQEIELHLISISHRKPIRLHAEVIWCNVAADGEIYVGVQFRRSLPFRDVQLV